MRDSKEYLWIRESLSVNFFATTDILYNHIGLPSHEYHTNFLDTSVRA